MGLPDRQPRVLGIFYMAAVIAFVLYAVNVGAMVWELLKVVWE